MEEPRADLVGNVAVAGGRVRYRIFGTGAATPLVCLHRGPGYPSDYLEPLTGLRSERPVVLYDQLGCGRSERPDDPSLWVAERFVDELGRVVADLGLDRYHLLGHAWGSMLATDFALTKPAGLASLVLASPSLSIPIWLEDLNAYRAQLPADVQATLAAHEAAGTTDSAEYEAATQVFYRRHLCRLVPWPDPLLRTIAGLGRPVYQAMWGPAEFTMTGNLKGYDRTPRLGELAGIPTLFTCGELDEATPGATGWYRSLLPGAELVVFPGCSHMPHLEEPAAYLKVVSEFLSAHE